MRPIDELAANICALAGHLNAAHHRWLLLIAEFDRRVGWSDTATQSCAHWLNWKCGIAMGAAREKVRVARSLESLPKISAAMESGKLSYSKVREITRIGNSENEDYLLMIAEHGTAQHVEKLVRAYRRCQDAEELSREARQQLSRCVTFRYDDDGSLRFVKANGKAIDSVAPGFTQPPGNWRRLPTGAAPAQWKGDRMDFDLAVEVLFQRAKRRKDVPAGTSGVG
jgi:hypothetical protein